MKKRQINFEKADESLRINRKILTKQKTNPYCICREITVWDFLNIQNSKNISWSSRYTITKIFVLICWIFLRRETLTDKSWRISRKLEKIAEESVDKSCQINRIFSKSKRRKILADKSWRIRRKFWQNCRRISEQILSN